jgi:hypothetical protein
VALFIEGMACPLCDKPMETNRGREIVCFSPFVSNLRDPLYFFHDGCFHEHCFSRHPLAEKALARQREMLERCKPWPPPCALCGSIITKPDDFFTLGHLTEEEDHPLHRFNYFRAHVQCLSHWKELGHVIDLVEELKRSGTWEGTALDYLLDEMRPAFRAGHAQG